MKRVFLSKAPLPLVTAQSRHFLFTATYRAVTKGSGYLLGALTLVCAPLAMPQHDTSETAFVETARAATAKYQDRSVAIADGYRQIGSDFPAMGEHWINIGLLFDGKFDPAHPEVLTYVVVSGTPRLLGVAYVLPLLKGESAPDWPVGKDKWHDHFRTLDEETTLPEHHAAGHAGDAPRLTMLHAWIWLPNPAGVFEADNWAIPYFRLGIGTPQDPPEAAAKALALASGGAEYFSASIRAAVPLTAGESKKVDAVFARSRAAVEALLRRPSITAATPSELESLSAIWTKLWKEIDASVSPRKVGKPKPSAP